MKRWIRRRSLCFRLSRLRGVSYNTKIGLADGDLREASALGGDVIRLLDSLVAQDILYEVPPDDLRVLEEVSTQTRAAIAKLDDARSRLAALRDRSQAEPQTQTSPQALALTAEQPNPAPSTPPAKLLRFFRAVSFRPREVLHRSSDGFRGSPWRV